MSASGADWTRILDGAFRRRVAMARRVRLLTGLDFLFRSHVSPCRRAYIEALSSGPSAYYIGKERVVLDFL